MFKVLGVKQHFLKTIEVYGVKWHIIIIKMLTAY